MNIDEIRERYARQSACGHPALTLEAIAEADRLATRTADSSATYLTCPDCGWKGYGYETSDGDRELREEPKGAGESVAW